MGTLALTEMWVHKGVGTSISLLSEQMDANAIFLTRELKNIVGDNSQSSSLSYI